MGYPRSWAFFQINNWKYTPYLNGIFLLPTFPNFFYAIYIANANLNALLFLDLISNNHL